MSAPQNPVSTATATATAQALAPAAASAQAVQAPGPDTSGLPAVVRLLHLEDSEFDHELSLAYLNRAGLRTQALRVDTKAQFIQALERHWDVIISDYHLPDFSGLDALALVRQVVPDIPFVLVSGQIGEETAVAAMRSGARDYLLKSNLARLAPALEQAMAGAAARRARFASERALAESRKRLQELAQHLQTSVEAERHAIAREIHDDVGGSLTALRFELDWIRRHVQDPKVQQRLGTASESLTHAMQSSQRIMQNLRPAILEQGLVAALQWMVAGFERRTGIACTLSTSHERMQLPTGVPLVVYRTAQEALTNVSKHAKASHVGLDLSLFAGTLMLEVNDNGQGLAAPDLAKAQSFGLRGLHERASTVGGWMEISAGPQGGTTLILTVPLEDEALPEPKRLNGLDAPAGTALQDPGDADSGIQQPIDKTKPNAEDDEPWVTHY